MPLIVGTNTYTDIANANAYFADRLRSDAWNNATDADKERALIMATTEIDRLAFTGGVAHLDQRLAWPRFNVRDTEGRILPDDTVPDRVVAATCEWALALLTGPADDGPAVQRKKVGDLEIHYRSATPDAVPSTVRALLQPFLRSTRASVAMVP